MKFLKYIILFIFCIAPIYSFADWHGGTITQLNVGYDGTTISFKLNGWDRNNCTCYSTWPNAMCLNITRTTFDFEKSMLLSARARGSNINAYIDETTCMVTAIYEIN